MKQVRKIFVPTSLLLVHHRGNTLFLTLEAA
jgi:hypothetical protein